MHRHRFCRTVVPIVAVAVACLADARAQATLYTAFGDHAGDKLGRAVGAAGDVDGDGRPDAIAGAYLGDGLGADAGYARVLAGGAGSPLLTFHGEQNAEQLGFSVGGAGDVASTAALEVTTG